MIIVCNTCKCTVCTLLSVRSTILCFMSSSTLTTDRRLSFALILPVVEALAVVASPNEEPVENWTSDGVNYDPVTPCMLDSIPDIIGNSYHRHEHRKLPVWQKTRGNCLLGPYQCSVIEAKPR